MSEKKTQSRRTFPLSLVEKYYPRAWDCRLPFLHPTLAATRPKLIKAGIVNTLIIQLLFFALFCYLFGALYQQGPRTHNLDVLWVDYDGGRVVGQAVNAAYARLRSDQFPTLVARPVSQYPSADALREAVCDADYWAAATAQGTRAVYNTIAIVLILLQNFFFLATINGLYVQFKIYNRAPPRFIILIRAAISCVYTFLGGLLITAAIWAFKAGWDVSGAAFVLDWATFWLLGHVSFLVLDVFSIWIPPQYVPFALVTWVVTNVTSVIVPFSLSNGFYRWGYALPAHAAYEVLTDIWSGGCNPHLYFALPVLFAYEVLGILGTSLGVYKRCHLAVVAEEATKQASVLLEQTRERRQSRANGEALIAGGSGRVAGTRAEDAEEEEREQREELDEEDELAVEDIQRLETQATRIYSNLGPSFQLVGSDERQG
ncbi:hypothetical protein H633G_09832 [Metarhizium anisopliae BRIP 53284]|nr:hypothetical protein H633G_09832 [Metarhizium anisopliae BRIP 53284]